MNESRNKTRDPSYLSYLRENHLSVLIAIAFFILGWILFFLSSALWSRALGAVALGTSFFICVYSAWKSGVIQTNGKTVSRQENPIRFRVYLILWGLFSLGFSIVLLLGAFEIAKR